MRYVLSRMLLHVRENFVTAGAGGGSAEGDREEGQVAGKKVAKKVAKSVGCSQKAKVDRRRLGFSDRR